VCIPSGNPVSNYFFALKVYEWAQSGKKEICVYGFELSCWMFVKSAHVDEAQSDVSIFY
jgi:hypothetical protein